MGDERARIAQRKFRAAHPERYRAQAKASAARRKARHPEQHRAVQAKSRLKHTLHSHGATVADYEALLVAQHGLCASCLSPESVRAPNQNHARQLSIDHDHETGRMRGLLCSRCNAALGLLLDDPLRIQALLEYSTAHSR